MGANKQEPLVAYREFRSIAPNAEAELFFFQPWGQAKLVRVSVALDTALVTDSDSGSVLQVLNRGTSGTATPTVLAQKTFSTVSAVTQSATIPFTLTIQNEDIDEGCVVTFKRATIGTGTAIGDLKLWAEYVQL